MAKIIYVIVFFSTAIFFQNCSNEFEIQEKPTLVDQNNNSNSNLNTNDTDTDERQDSNMELPLSTSCAPAASDVILIDTLLPNNPPHGTGYGRIDFLNNSPNTTHAFKFRVGSRKVEEAVASGSITATAMTGGQGKHVLITACPNDTTAITPRCDKWSAESTRIDYCKPC
ncbi:MAG TPA: hypothetical protein PLJ21_13740 [Pseudobdellovibrionaceae bacterium]|nr:hypothetical protein [Pseudobdellovibrionaceae bacterium]